MSRKRKADDVVNQPRRSSRRPIEKLYKYETLRPGKIRVLALSPAKPNDHLRGTLEIVSIGKHPSYKAISYAWGDPIFPDTLFLPEGQLRITNSLHGALRSFRRRYVPVRLWADAICINQNGIEEKKHQVNMMAEVCRQAEEVLVRLGEAMDSDCLALWTASSLSFKDVCSAGDLRNHFNSKEVNATKTSICPSCRSTAVHVTCSIAEALNALTKSVWAHPWFQRLWVLQEVFVAQSATFYYGSHTYTLSQLVMASNFHWRSTQSFDRDTMIECNDEASVVRAAHWTPHDRLYAFRAAIHTPSSGPCPCDILAPNYALSLRKLWISVTTFCLARKWLITSGLPPSFVLALSCTRSSVRTKRVPSRAPDFANLTSQSKRKLVYSLEHSTMCSTGGDLSPYLNFVESCPDSVLSLWAVLADSVRGFCPLAIPACYLQRPPMEK